MTLVELANIFRRLYMHFWQLCMHLFSDKKLNEITIPANVAETDASAFSGYNTLEEVK